MGWILPGVLVQVTMLATVPGEQWLTLYSVSGTVLSLEKQKTL